MTFDPRLLIENRAVFRGHKMYHHGQESVSRGIVAGDYEASELLFLVGYLRSGMVALDVGANIGTHTLEMARCVGDRGLVLAFEPAPDNYRLLTLNIAENGYTNVWPVCAALGCSVGTRALHLNPEGNNGDHRMWMDDAPRKTALVRGLTLDDYMGRWGITPDLIKLDTQGSEYEILLGGATLLQRAANVLLVMELWPKGLLGNGDSVALLSGLLRKLGFNHVYMLPGGSEQSLFDFSDIWLEGLLELPLYNENRQRVANPEHLYNLVVSKKPLVPVPMPI